MSEEKINPIRNGHFSIEIEGLKPMTFKEVSGLELQVSPVYENHQDSKGLQVRRPHPGPVEYQPIVLTRSITSEEMDLWEWVDQVRKGGINDARRNGSIVLYFDDGTEAARFNFFAGWPAVYYVSSLEAGSTDMTHETVILYIERLERVK